MVIADPILPGSAATDETKAYLRVETAVEDALIERLVRSAAELCEDFVGQAMLVRTFVETLPRGDATAGPRIGAWQRLARAPVQAVAAVEDLPAEGSPVALAADGYAIDIDANGDGWVRVTQTGGAKRIRVTYEAGLAPAWGDLPEALCQGIVRLAAHLYAHRDGAEDSGPPAAVAALWRPHRRIRFR